jgi:hypothetical protein
MGLCGSFSPGKDDLHKAFSMAESLVDEATAAAAEVERLKVELSNAIAKAADLATKAAAVALAGVEKAKSRSAQLYLQVQHHVDAAVYQSSQAVPVPAPIASTTTVHAAPTLISAPIENTAPPQDEVILTDMETEANAAQA